MKQIPCYAEQFRTSKRHFFSQSQGQYSLQKSQMYLMLTKIKIFQGFLHRIEFFQILASTMLSISHTAKTYYYIWKTLYNIIIVKFNLIELVFQTSLPLQPSDYVYVSPSAYTPTQNNVPVIFYQKQEYNASYPIP